MATSKRFGSLVLAVGIVAAAAAGWYYWRSSAEPAPEYSTVTVSRGDIIQVVTATGGLQAVTSVDVSSQISGLIKEVAVDFNTPVKVGQVLAQLDPATYESRLNSANAQLANTSASYTLVRLNTERTRTLLRQNLVSQQELDQAEAQLAQAQAQLQIQQAAVETAKVDLARCTIYSPIDGIVIDRQADVGKTVAASLNAPTLFTIANDLSKMQISAAVAEADIGNAETGQQVNFTVDAYPNRQFRGRISQIRNAPKTQQNVVTYETMIDVRNDDLKLKPGMTANVSIVIAQRLGALKVPNAALRARIPEGLIPPPSKAAAVAGQPAPAAKTLADDERRKAMREIFREAGFSFGSGPPTPEVLARVEQLAKERGIEVDLSRWGGRGGDRGGNASAPVSRTVYKLVGSDPKTQHPAALTAKFGISDGVVTEVIAGLEEGDVLITAVAQPASSGGTSPTTNPFSGRPSFGGPRPGR